MSIPDAIKTNFHTLEKAFRNGGIALLECRNSNNGEPAYAICAINPLRQADREPEIEMVPCGLMFSSDPYETLIRVLRQNGVGTCFTSADAIQPKDTKEPLWSRFKKASENLYAA